MEQNKNIKCLNLEIVQVFEDQKVLLNLMASAH